MPSILTWGARGTGGTASKAYYGEATLPLTSTGREFEFEADFDHADAGYSQYGFSAFEMRTLESGTSWQYFMSLYHGVGMNRDQLVLNVRNGQPEVYSAPGVIIPGTKQRITVRGTLSTVSGGLVNADGAMQVLVDGVVVIDTPAIKLGLWYLVTPGGVARWDLLMVNPMGRLDNLRVQAGPTIGVGPSTLQYYHSDAVGAVRAVSDATGSLVETFDYAPFGERWSYSPTPERRGYAGKEFDPDTMLDYFGARYYASNTGRFTNVDPLGSSAKLTNPQTFNRYVYALNNPMRYIDPQGLEVSEECARDPKCTIVVKINVIYDKGLKLTPELKAKIESEQLARAQELYASSNIRLDISYSAQSPRVEFRGGQVWILSGLDPAALNIVYTNVALYSGSGVTDKNVAVSIVKPLTMTSLVSSTFNETGHELGHQFLGHSYVSRSKLKNLWLDWADVNPKLFQQDRGVSVPNFRLGLEPRVYATPATVVPKQ